MAQVKFAEYIAQTVNAVKAQPLAGTTDVKTDGTGNIVSGGSNSEIETLKRRLEEVERQKPRLGANAP